VSASARIIRGRIFSFTDDPATAGLSARHYLDDGAVLVRDGLIEAVGEARAVLAGVPDGAAVDDHSGSLIVPGFIDAHIHYPQTQVIGSYGAQLLDWLHNYTFVEEQKFADPGHCARIAEFFLDELIRCGTTTAMVYCTVHPQSVDAFFAASERRGARMIAGKTMMDRDAPDALRDTAQRGYDESKALIERWRERGRLDYAITPRFAVTSSQEQLEAAGALAREFPDAYVQTHLDENDAEIELVARLFAGARNYLDVYDRAGLLGPRSVFGHCIHLKEAEVVALAATRSVAAFCPTSNLFLGSGLFDQARLVRAGVRVALAATRSVAAFCPTSNLFLGSGLFDHARLVRAGVRVALATDVGGGTSYSMLRTAAEGYKVLQLNRQSWPAAQAFYRMTLGNARALGLDDRIGSITVGKEADLIVLDSRATPAMAHRMETVKGDLDAELFTLITMGDDRAVRQTYVAGAPAKS
jgi:guanine deaminase